MRPRVSVRSSKRDMHLERSAFCVSFVFSVAILRSRPYFSCKCNISKVFTLAFTLKFEMKLSLCKYVCYFHHDACVHFVICDSNGS